MADYVTKIRTTDGDKQIDFNALANLPASETYITADEREYWNAKMDAEDILSDDTAGLYGLPAGSTVDDIFSWIGEYNHHWWSATTYNTITKYKVEKRTFDLEYSAEIHLHKSGTIYYSDKYDFDEDTGNISLVNPYILSDDDDWTVLNSKYIQSKDGIRAANATDTLGTIVLGTIFVPSSPLISYSDTSGEKPVVGYKASDSNNIFYVELPISYPYNDVGLQYVHSHLRDAYPDNGSIGNTIYKYLDVPFKKMAYNVKIDAKIGDLKNSINKDQGEDWLLANGAVLSHSEYPEIGNIRKDYFATKKIKVKNERLYNAVYINDVVYANGLYVGAGYVNVTEEKKSYNKASIFYTNDLYGMWDVLIIGVSNTTLNRIYYGSGEYVAYNSGTSVAYVSISPKTSWQSISTVTTNPCVTYGNGYWLCAQLTSSSRVKTFYIYYTSNIIAGFNQDDKITITLSSYNNLRDIMFSDNDKTFVVLFNNDTSTTYMYSNFTNPTNVSWTTKVISNFAGKSIQYINGMYIMVGSKYTNSSYYPGIASSNDISNESWDLDAVYKSNIGNSSYYNYGTPIAYDEAEKRWAFACSPSASMTYVFVSENENFNGTWSCCTFNEMHNSYNLFFNNGKFIYFDGGKMISNEYFNLPNISNSNDYYTFIKVR